MFKYSRITDNHSTGINTALGQNIIVLSTLLSVDQPIQLTISSANEIIPTIKSIFQISDEKLKIIIADQLELPTPQENFLSDHSKFFSSYIKAPEILINGQILKTNKKNKKCIGLAIARQSNHYQDILPSFNGPWNRYYPKEIWNKIISLILTSGYDVITFNSLDVSLEDKIFMLNEMCECLIGYEGGMTHVAHCLDIPTIMFPWHHDGDGSSPDDFTLITKYQKLHVDRKTWFLSNPEEILNWNQQDLNTTIKKLHNNQGNSIYLSDNVKIDFDNLTLYDTKNSINLTPMIPTYESDFIKTYIKPTKIG